MTMTIPQPVKNTLERVGIDYKYLLEDNEKQVVSNRFTGESVETNALIAELINWVYETSNAYERGNYKVNVSDFDRIRYFVMKVDSNAYMTCLD